MMRIITGRARGTHLYTLEGDTTRPTTERAKEAVFSILFDSVKDCRVLDLYAGSGQLGLEAVSRGAAHATFVDCSRDAVAVIRKNVQKTHFDSECTVICSDVRDYLRTAAGQFDLVFLDPPYAFDVTKDDIRQLVKRGLLSPRAIVVAETGSPMGVFSRDGEESSRFEIRKSVRYGKAFVTILQYSGGENENSTDIGDV